MKRIVFGALAALTLAGTASADCYYNGYNYPVGSTVCASGGWLQECTVASYWKAIGYCRAEEGKPATSYTTVTETEHLAAGGKPAPEGEIKGDQE